MTARLNIYIPGSIGIAVLILYFAMAVVVSIPRTQYKLKMLAFYEFKTEDFVFTKAMFYHRVSYSEEVIIPARRPDLIQRQINLLKLRSSKNAVIRVPFHANNSYGDFVRVINLLVKNNIRRYVYIDDRVYVFSE